MVLLMSGLETRVYRLPFAIGSRAHLIPPTVFGAPETFVERGVGSAFGRTGAFPAASIVLAQSAPLVRTIYVVREEFAVPGRLAIRLAGLRGQHAIGKARRATAATFIRHARTASGELMCAPYR